MARRIPLPRLSRRQRLARWQRERRQQLLYLTFFTALFVFVVGLVAWAGASSYYDGNLKPAARIDGRSIPMRDFNRRFTFEKVRFYNNFGIPEDSENDPQVSGQAASLRKAALDAVVQGELLLTVAREERSVPAGADVDARLERDFGELHVRHILISVDADATDKAKAEADAKAKAEDVAKQLQADPKNDQLWKDLAAKESRDPGSKDNGGDLGWVSASSGFVKEFEDAMLGLPDGQVSDPVKSSFGHHIIQRIETRAVAQTPLFTRLKRTGVALEDLRGYARANLLQQRYEQKAKDAAIPSAQEQVHLAVIVIQLPPPTNIEQYTQALQKINAVSDGLRDGKDFGDLAKEFSDDFETKDEGGDMGWVTRAMLPNTIIADDVFKKQEGERTEQHSLNSAGDLAMYKVLGRDPARLVTEEQMVKIRAGAFALWIKDQESRLGVLRLIPGLEF